MGGTLRAQSRPGPSDAAQARTRCPGGLTGWGWRMPRRMTAGIGFATVPNAGRPYGFRPGGRRGRTWRTWSADRAARWGPSERRRADRVARRPSARRAAFGGWAAAAPDGRSAPAPSWYPARMARVKCELHGPPTGKTHTYSATPYVPIGHPDSGLICGASSCQRPGLVWRAHSRFPGHALTPTGVMAIRCKQFHLPDL